MAEVKDKVPFPRFGPVKEALLYCYMGGGVAWQPPHVSAVVCRARSRVAAVAVILAGRLLSLRSPCDTALHLCKESVKADCFESPISAGVQEEAFLGAVQDGASRLAAVVGADVQAMSSQRSCCTVQQAHRAIAVLLREGQRSSCGSWPPTSVPGGLSSGSRG